MCVISHLEFLAGLGGRGSSFRRFEASLSVCDKSFRVLGWAGRARLLISLSRGAQEARDEGLPFYFRRQRSSGSDSSSAAGMALATPCRICWLASTGLSSVAVLASSALRGAK